MTMRENAHDGGPSGVVMEGIGTQRHTGHRVVQSHEKKFIASKNKDKMIPIQYGGGAALHEQMSMSSFSSIYQGTVPGMREHDSILNDSMTTPPSRKSSRDGYIDA